MIVLINYADDTFKKSQQLNTTTGKEIGLFDKIISYSPKDIEPSFLKRNKKILSQKRGNGYWLWKPYFIKKTLELLNDGDFLFYCDSGAYFIKPITPLIDISLDTGQDIIVFELKPRQEKIWTKRDAFKLMDCDSAKYTNSKQRLGGFSLWKKSAYTMNFVDEYLGYAQDERIITDALNQCGHPNYPEFEEHRHDQSILSLLSKKHDLVAYRDPSQWGNKSKSSYQNSKYDQLIESTRKRCVIAPKISRKEMLKNRKRRANDVLSFALVLAFIFTVINANHSLGRLHFFY